MLRVAEHPEQTLRLDQVREIRQSRVEFPDHEKAMLVRVVVDSRGGEDVIVTAYRTSKVSKYWVTP